MKLLPLALLLAFLAAPAAADEIRIYDNRLNLKYRVEGAKIYDNRNRQVGSIERGRVYDNRLNRRYTVEGGDKKERK